MYVSEWIYHINQYYTKNLVTNTQRLIVIPRFNPKHNYTLKNALKEATLTYTQAITKYCINYYRFSPEYQQLIQYIQGKIHYTDNIK